MADFLRTLAKGGNGPDEFLRAEALALDEINDILYINHGVILIIF